MTNILVCDDDKEIVEAIEIYLAQEGYNVIKAYDGEQAIRALKENDIQLLIIDIMMPKLDGIHATLKIREYSSIPIIILSAKSEDADKILGLNIGADDYMTKPVNYEELTWRINALLRRAHIASERRIVIGPVVLDSNTYTVSRGEQVLELPKKEFELLYKLLSYPGQIFTRNQLLDDIWGFDSESGEDTVKTHISRLRNKLRAIEEFRIITIKGLGYKAEVLE